VALSLKSKLVRRWIAAFVALVALAVGSTAVAFVSGRLTVSSFRSSATEIEDRSSVLTQLGADLEKWEGIADAILEGESNGDPNEDPEDFEPVSASLDHGFDAARPLFETGRHRGAFAEAEEGWVRARDAVTGYLDEPSEARLQEALEIAEGIEEVMEAVGQLQVAAVSDLRSDLDAAEDRERTLFAVVVAAVVLLVGSTAFIVRSLTRRTLVPILRLDEGVGRFAAGDLDHRVEIGDDDELGALASSFNLMADALASNQRTLAHQAAHDSLTGLANRANFRSRLAAALGASAGNGVSVLFIDLDDFKVVNDVDGHEAGDRLLELVGERLLGCCRGGDLVARLGGDEFAVLVDHAVGHRPAVGMAERVQRALAAPFAIGGKPIRVAASIGIATAPSPDFDPDELLRQADVAMYAAKGSGKARFDIFDADLHDAALDRMTLRTDVVGAADRGELVVHYQPVYDLASERVQGVEALVRWQHPTRGLLLPDAFLPAAESTGELRSLTRFVLGTACRQVRAWQWEHPGHRDLWLSVNISGSSIMAGGLAEDVEHALADSGLPASSLVLELTETVLVHDLAGDAWSEVAALQARGVRVAIDDFGTGFSSLAYLNRLSVDILKIDRSFVSGEGAVDQVPLLQTIMSLGEALGLVVVAEGIEERAQLDQLATLGCGLGQGYLLGRPGPAASIAATLERAEAEALFDAV
jgi:diguanylate cyclase (GGDEF)-like protein